MIHTLKCSVCGATHDQEMSISEEQHHREAAHLPRFWEGFDRGEAMKVQKAEKKGGK